MVRKGLLAKMHHTSSYATVLVTTSTDSDRPDSQEAILNSLTKSSRSSHYLQTREGSQDTLVRKQRANQITVLIRDPRGQTEYHGRISHAPSDTLQ